MMKIIICLYIPSSTLYYDHYVNQCPMTNLYAVSIRFMKNKSKENAQFGEHTAENLLKWRLNACTLYGNGNLMLLINALNQLYSTLHSLQVVVRVLTILSCRFPTVYLFDCVDYLLYMYVCCIVLVLVNSCNPLFQSAWSCC